MNKDEIVKYLKELNRRLREKNIKGQVALFGGAVMCIALNARMSTKDIDAVFEPKQTIYDIAKNMAEEYGLPKDWINDSVKGFLREKPDMRVFQNMSNLTVYVPSPEYMLAMKCMSARLAETTDKEDIMFLLKHLKIKTVDEAIKITLKYFPQQILTPKIEYLLTELLEGAGGD
jgi:predicted nucleotidyltransferase